LFGKDILCWRQVSATLASELLEELCPARAAGSHLKFRKKVVTE